MQSTKVRRKPKKKQILGPLYEGGVRPGEKGPAGEATTHEKTISKSTKKKKKKKVWEGKKRDERGTGKTETESGGGSENGPQGVTR